MKKITLYRMDFEDARGEYEPWADLLKTLGVRAEDPDEIDEVTLTVDGVQVGI